ncbi:MAG: hypothetical protein HYU66_04785 [Armatimonadetes bacterium]|nr:hypothetical protein [Armatimonadota bacterium]
MPIAGEDEERGIWWDGQREVTPDDPDYEKWAAEADRIAALFPPRRRRTAPEPPRTAG